MARSETGSTFDRSDFPIKDRVFIVCEVLLYVGKCSMNYILNVILRVLHATILFSTKFKEGLLPSFNIGNKAIQTLSN